MKKQLRRNATHGTSIDSLSAVEILQARDASAVGLCRRRSGTEQVKDKVTKASICFIRETTVDIDLAENRN